MYIQYITYAFTAELTQNEPFWAILLYANAFTRPLILNLSSAADSLLALTSTRVHIELSLPGAVSYGTNTLTRYWILSPSWTTPQGNTLTVTGVRILHPPLPTVDVNTLTSTCLYILLLSLIAKYIGTPTLTCVWVYNHWWKTRIVRVFFAFTETCAAILNHIVVFTANIWTFTFTCVCIHHHGFCTVLCTGAHTLTSVKVELHWCHTSCNNIWTAYTKTRSRIKYHCTLPALWHFITLTFTLNIIESLNLIIAIIWRAGGTYTITRSSTSDLVPLTFIWTYTGTVVHVKHQVTTKCLRQITGLTNHEVEL